MPTQHLEIDDWRRDYAAATTGRSQLSAFADSWPIAYIAAATPQRATTDAVKLIVLEPGAVRVGVTDGPENALRLTVYAAGRSLTLGEMLPGLQSLGLEVLAEQPYAVTRPDQVPCWIYDFAVRVPAERGSDAVPGDRLADALMAIWSGLTESDPFNELVVAAGTDWREAALLRTYGQYLHQVGVPWGRTYTAAVLSAHPLIAQQLLDLFHLRFRPPHEGAAGTDGQDDLAIGIEKAVDQVANLTADRVLRGYLGLIRATVRTNFYRTDGDGSGSIAVKLEPGRLNFVSEPRPRFEVFVSSPRIEGVHLRFGLIARGGLRWSDRHEDLRTEILGLATAQVAKNAVIVPTGAKGGYVLKDAANRNGAPRPISALEGYREFISALLDVHDDLDPVSRQPIRRPDTVAYEGADAYLVVAADKGTAAFSDAANEIATARGFWLGDAFASGGSAGYNHKAMGITAKGAWCSVRRHLRELGLDPNADDVTVVGIGDMSGDVFGNGMLLSRHVRLVAAFDHRHIFLDPTPDPEKSFAERSRLWRLPRSTWADYDPALISPGGGVHPRTAKSIAVTAQLADALGLDPKAASLTPAELVKAILTAPVDLLWNGGIGTYVKASTEQNSDAADKVNDAVRIDATQLRARVVGEGGNLGLTPHARIEFARHGGKLNTDAIDNSAGVGCSDLEVNIKIALSRLPDLTAADRSALLVSMTDEVSELVLHENTSQNELLGQTRQFAPDDLHLHARIISRLEAAGLDRAILALPDDAEIGRRLRAGEGLTSPELSVLAAQVKRDLRTALVADDVTADPTVESFLLGYFPGPLRRYPESVLGHPLRREIIATALANRVVDQAGISYLHRMHENANAEPGDAVRAFLVITAVFDLPSLWDRIRESSLGTAVAGELVRESLRVLDSASRWLLRNRPQPVDIAAETARLRPPVQGLVAGFGGLLRAADHIDVQRRLGAVADGVGPDRGLAREVYELIDRYCLLDITEIAHEFGVPAHRVAEIYFRLKDRRRINVLLADVADLPRGDRWTALARLGLHDDLYEAARAMCCAVLATTPSESTPDEALDRWEQRLGPRLGNVESLVAASRSSVGPVNLAVAARQIRILAMLSTRGA